MAPPRIGAHAWILLLVMLSFALLLAACGVDSNTVEKVDDAVKLIQDVDRDGTWSYLTDGLDALAEQSPYAATITLHDGPTDIVIAILVDAEGNAQFSYIRGTTPDLYFVPGLHTDRDTADPVPVYTINDGVATCADTATAQRFNRGEHSIFEYFGIPMMAEHTLSVAELDDDSTLLDRDTDRYVLESQLAEALEILDRTDNANLRERVEGHLQVDFAGTFDLDDDTGALLRFESVYTDIQRIKTIEFAFEVTQWADSPAFDPIALNGELPACE